MTCYTFASLWKFQYFRWPAYNPVEHLWWRCYCKNSKQLSIFTKKLYDNARMDSKYDTAFTWRLFKRFISLKYFTSNDYWNLLFLVKCLTSFNSSKMLLTLFRMGIFGAAHGWGAKKDPLPKICHTYPTMVKLGTDIPCLKKIQKIYESRVTPLELCPHHHFFTGNQQIWLYQEIQI